MDAINQNIKDLLRLHKAIKDLNRRVDLRIEAIKAERARERQERLDREWVEAIEESINPGVMK